MTDASKFLLLDRLAVGGMAELYRAKSLGVLGFEKIIAIKRILPALAEDDEFVQMFVEEAKIAGRLRHANIVRIFELGKVEDTHFIAMEYVFGRDCLQLRKDLEKAGRRMPPGMAAFIIAGVLSGLDYAHRQRGPDGQHLGIIHRDVSPPNILVSYDGLVKLCDFGIAKAASRATQTVAGVIKGKLGYMSPEQITGQPIDHRSDVFAASTVLWELLTGERLFGKGNDLEVIERVRAAEAKPPSTIVPEISPALDAVVMKGLTRDPNDRWETAGDMHEALMGIVMMSQPPFSTARLAEWMRGEYGKLIEQQNAHLERLTGVEEPGVNVSSGSVDLPLADEWGDETVATAPPFGFEDGSEVSSVIQIEDRVPLSRPDEPDDSMPPPPMPRAGRRSMEHSEMVALSSAGLAPQRTSPIPSDRPPPPRPETSGSIDVDLDALNEPEPVPEPVPEPESSIKIPIPTPLPPAPAEEPGGMRWGLLVLVALVAMIVGVGGVVLWLYLTGRPLPFLDS